MTTATLWAWLAALPWKTAGGALVYALWERWLGRTPSTPAASTLDLLIHLWQYHRWGPPVPKPVPATIGTGGPPPPKEETPATMPNPNVTNLTLAVDKPTMDLMNALRDVLDKIASGTKPADVAAQELPQLFALFQEVGQIPADLKADPESVESAIMIGLVQIGKRLRDYLARPLPPGK